METKRVKVKHDCYLDKVVAGEVERSGLTWNLSLRKDRHELSMVYIHDLKERKKF